MLTTEEQKDYNLFMTSFSAYAFVETKTITTSHNNVKVYIDEKLITLKDVNGNTVETGPLISIRNPLWTAAIPRQDIPIMVFTLAQWETLQREEFSVGAAPARYNYAFPVGFEEVEEILKGNPLQPVNVN